MSERITDVQQLENVRESVSNKLAKWTFYRAAYDGTEELMEQPGVLDRHPRESEDNYTVRKGEAYGYGYSTSIVDILSFYLFATDPKPSYGKLENDELFAQFLTDCDMFNTDFDVWFRQQQQEASIRGHVGLLVDKPKAAASTPSEVVALRTRADDINANIYPYVSAYVANAILDWHYEANAQGRPVLAYLKLKEQDEETGNARYRVWTLEDWRLYAIENSEVVVLEEGPNPLGVIPFVWLMNVVSGTRNIGVSDIKEISRIDASIIRNLSQSEEVVDYAAFPIIMKPFLRHRASTTGGATDDDSHGVSAVIEFDPEYPEAVPKWLASEVQGPIASMLDWLNRKREEIYRIANTGGITATEITKAAKSGVAMTKEYQLLHAKLADKSRNVIEAKLNVLYLWTLWQGQTDMFKDIEIMRPTSFAISDLITDLQGLLLGQEIVNSPTYQMEVQKLTARRTLTNAVDNFQDIDKEIEGARGAKPTQFAAGGTGGAAGDAGTFEFGADTGNTGGTSGGTGNTGEGAAA